MDNIIKHNQILKNGLIYTTQKICFFGLTVNCVGLTWLLMSLPAGGEFLPPPPMPTINHGNNGANNWSPLVVGEYILGAGDTIEIDIFNVPEYSGERGRHQVSVDGSLNLPLIGRVTVQGMTIDQVSELLKERYGEYLQRPLITVKLLERRPVQVAIAGEVKRPGSYMVSGNSQSQNMGGVSNAATVTGVLRMAGGITTSADIRQVKIRRPGGGGEETIVNLDLWELLQNGDLSQDLALRDGDRIYIPTVTNINRHEARQLSSANFASNADGPINVAVVGEVNRPGTHILSIDTMAGTEGENVSEWRGIVGVDPVGVYTVTRAIKAAGGITPEANIREIQVRRISRTGTEQTVMVDLWKLLQEGDLQEDIALQGGDTIIVPKGGTVDATVSGNVATASFSPGIMRVSVVGEVLQPGAISLPPNSSLNQVILAAGGLKRGQADSNRVELIRISPDGTVSRRVISVNLSDDVNEANNPVLRNNDVVMVNRSGGAAFREGMGTVFNTLNPISNVLGLMRFISIF
ncbi:MULTISPECIES: SLBB domain-containing protein [Limnospira]|uniref:Capsule polysaccharide export protein n=1 Tax=Limnospira indica PCC 8005 TaxID=376219 RepID=A0A9P1KF63_9CYAN|nr:MULTISPECIES: SLBB domain-containing protein [unclassified Limnospira]MDT9187714.1 SLBB domain-containing protein [Limnospira sp. PMC 894.15]MDT9233548.1 SLBB domain-containing protein [Limnospira sp. PMC 917.15]MDY7053252.1 SLBB domain-containing protein [Limnospira fusiformis LS22]CDM95625.1 putative capsule polysaccharide export protein [Limnospira indica PCC 8005]